MLEPISFLEKVLGSILDQARFRLSALVNKGPGIIDFIKAV